jgi:ABC-2 type transport system ATP-binding protein
VVWQLRDSSGGGKSDTVSSVSWAISVDSLRKHFAKVNAINDLTFTVAAGSVTALLGPNGSGKTTTLRILGGLVRPSSGAATIYGQRYRDLPQPGHIVGVLLDGDTFYPGRSAFDHLRVYAKAMGLDDSRVPSMLTYVGLNPPIGRALVRKFSLGMRQRLALAAAMLGDPKVLIMDEPSNGLDPEGAWWLDQTLRDFADSREGSVLISTHSISEVERVADSIVVIVEGRQVYWSTVDDLKYQIQAVSVETDDAARLAEEARTLGAVAAVSVDGSVQVMSSSLPEVVARLRMARAPVGSVFPAPLSLEEKVNLITGSSHPPGRAAGSAYQSH